MPLTKRKACSSGGSESNTSKSTDICSSAEDVGLASKIPRILMDPLMNSKGFPRKIVFEFPNDAEVDNVFEDSSTLSSELQGLLFGVVITTAMHRVQYSNIIIELIITLCINIGNYFNINHLLNIVIMFIGNML